MSKQKTPLWGKIIWGEREWANSASIFSYKGDLSLSFYPQFNHEKIHELGLSLYLDTASEYKKIDVSWSYAGGVVVYPSLTSEYSRRWPYKGSFSIDPSLSSIYKKLEAVYTCKGNLTLSFNLDSLIEWTYPYFGSQEISLLIDTLYNVPLRVDFFIDLNSDNNSIYQIDECRANDMYGTFHSSDLALGEMRCAICGKKVEEGESVIFVVNEVTEGGIRLTPIHENFEEYQERGKLLSR